MVHHVGQRQGEIKNIHHHHLGKHLESLYKLELETENIELVNTIGQLANDRTDTDNGLEQKQKNMEIKGPARTRP